MRLSVQELKNLLKQKKKKVCGKKEALVDRLIMTNIDEINSKIKNELLYKLKLIKDPKNEKSTSNLHPKIEKKTSIKSVKSINKKLTEKVTPISTLDHINIKHDIDPDSPSLSSNTDTRFTTFANLNKNKLHSQTSINNSNSNSNSNSSCNSPLTGITNSNSSNSSINHLKRLANIHSTNHLHNIHTIGGGINTSHINNLNIMARVNNSSINAALATMNNSPNHINSSLHSTGVNGHSNSNITINSTINTEINSNSSSNNSNNNSDNNNNNSRSNNIQILRNIQLQFAKEKESRNEEVKFEASKEELRDQLDDSYVASRALPIAEVMKSIRSTGNGVGDGGEVGNGDVEENGMNNDSISEQYYRIKRKFEFQEFLKSYTNSVKKIKNS